MVQHGAPIMKYILRTNDKFPFFSYSWHLEVIVCNLLWHVWK